MAAASGKAPQAYRTIGEVARETGLPQHILRYWETRFPELRPLQRAGNRRYYTPADIALVRRIDAMLNREGLTIRGAQQQLKQRPVAPLTPSAIAAPADDLSRLRALLADALVADQPEPGRP